MFTHRQEYHVQVIEIRLRDPEPKIVCKDGHVRRDDNCGKIETGQFRTDFHKLVELLFITYFFKF